MVVRGARVSKLWVRAVLVVVPIVGVPAMASLSVGFFARRGAALLYGWASHVPSSAGVLASATEQPVELDSFAGLFEAEPIVRESSVLLAEHHSRSGPREKSVGARPRAHRIYVGPDLVRRAVPASGRPTAAWTNRNQDHPAGMLISNPGALAGTILAGDIVFEAEGRSLSSFEELVTIVGQAYQRRAKVVSGRLWRRGEPWTVTVEPGWVMAARE